MNKLISRLSALGVPGLIYFFAVTHAGLLGGVTVVALVAMIGGPLGVMGAVGMASTITLIKGTVKAYGFEPVLETLLQAFEAKGMTREEIITKVDRYPVSHLLKKVINDEVLRSMDGE